MRTLHAPRVNLRRSVILLALSILIATLTSVGPLSRMAFAADAIWNGNALTYDGNTYKKTSTPPDRSGTPNEYEWRSTAGNSETANVLYLGEDPGNAQRATLVTYPIVGGTYNTSDASEPQTVTVTRDLTGEQDPNRSQSCAVDGVGWVVCPLSNWLADGVDWIYGIVSGFLDVQTISTEDNAIYQLWQLVRNVANAVFLIVFLIIIYSQLTGAGYSNYNIKDMIPRLILGAILVNVSFWICAVAVDASNLLGYSVQSILENVRNNYVTPIAIDWSAATAAILSGGGLAGFAGFAAATGGSISAMGFILLAALISAGLSVLAAFVILAARQALIVVLTAIAPLAFVAFMLPSTRKLFDKWQNLFTNMLILFPAFALLFGASQLAGAAIIKTAQTATSEMQLPLVLVGLTVQVIPLAMTPFLTRLSTGIMGQIANFSNNKQKGLTDRAKNWSQDMAAMNKSNKLAKTAHDVERRRNGEISRFGLRGRGAGRLGLRFDQQKRRRDATMKDNESYLDNRQDSYRQREIAEGTSRYGRRMYDRSIDAHDFHKQGETFRNQVEAAGDAHWQNRLDPNSHHFDQGVHRAELATRELKARAKRDEDKFEAIVREMEAGVNSYNGTEFDGLEEGVNDYLRSQNMNDRAQRLGELTFDIAQQEKRKNYADVKIKANEVGRLRSDDAAREYAGGIDDLGADKVLAKARSEHSAMHMENVKAYRSVYTNEGYSAQELMEVIEKGKLRGGAENTANEIQIHAAIQRLMSDVGNNWAAQKVIDWSATLGLDRDDATGMYYKVDARGNRTAVGDVNSEEVSYVRDMQQIVNDAISNSPLKVGYVSATQRSFMESGQYRVQAEKGFKTMSEQLVTFESMSGKYDAERISTMDPDELGRMVQLYRDDTFRASIPEDRRTAIVQAIENAQSNPMLKGRIKDRERGIMNVLASYLDPRDTRPPIQKEETYYVHPTTNRDDPEYGMRVPAGTPGAREVRVPVETPNVYRIDRQVDNVDGTGLKPPRRSTP